MMTTTSTTYKVFTMLVLMNKWMLVIAFGSLPYRHVHGHGHGHRKSNYAYDAPAKTAFTGTASSYSYSSSSSSTTNSRRTSQLPASSLKNTNVTTNKKIKSRIAVRPRPLLKLQEKGVYKRICDGGQDTDRTSSNGSTSTSASISASNPVPDASSHKEEINSSSWVAFKDGFYNCVDFVTRANSKNTISNSITNRKMAVAYSDTVEARLGNHNRSRANKSKPIAIKPPASSRADYGELEENLLLQYQASLKTSPFIENKDISNGENLYQSDLRKSFDSGKDVIYGTIDSLTAKKGKEGDFEGFAASLFPNTHEEFKVATKQSMNRDETLAIVLEYASDLTSANPIKRLKANLAIAADGRRRKRTLERERREATVNGIKQILVSDL